jgi:FKBP-type peptidyl-prolyl cis-trans isomerase SlyD
MSDEQREEADESQADADAPEEETEGYEDVAEADDVEGAEGDTEDGIGDGDFVRLAYTLRTADDGTVVDTTDEETAEEAEIDTEEYEFEPRVVVVGAGHVFESVDEALLGAEVGDSGTVEVSAAEAFGEYDDDEVRTVSANKIDEDERYPGAQVQIDGDQGRVVTMVGGRARVDFNHPLAGEDLEYEYDILEVVEDREEQAASMLEMYLQEAPEVWIETDTVEEEQVVEPDEDEEEDEEAEPETETVEVEKETLYIEATPQMTMNQQWMFSKQQIAQDVMDRLDLDRVIVQETIEGMGGMMGGLGGMMGGGGGAAPEDLEEAIEDVDVDADELADELDADLDE